MFAFNFTLRTCNTMTKLLVIFFLRVVVLLIYFILNTFKAVQSPVKPDIDEQKIHFKLILIGVTDEN